MSFLSLLLSRTAHLRANSFLVYFCALKHSVTIFFALISVSRQKLISLKISILVARRWGFLGAVITPARFFEKNS